MTFSKLAFSILPSVTKTIWQRGEDYAKRKLVREIREERGDLTAIVSGSQSYHVRFWWSRGAIEAECSCKYYRQHEEVCKHIVAAALVFDTNQGIRAPTVSEIDEHSAVDAGSAVDAMFADPLNVNLDHLREAASWGSWVRPHAKLPKAPATQTDSKKPLTLLEVRSAFGRIERWTERRNYDHYFCAGMVMAGICELLDIVRSRLPTTPTDRILDLLQLCAEKVDQACLEWVDGSNGDWLFPVARLWRLIRENETRVEDISAWEDFRKKLEQLEMGEYYFKKEVPKLHI